MTNWTRGVDPAPQLLALPPGVASLDEAHAAIDLWEFYARKRLDSSQRQVVEVMMACQDDGRWAAMTTGREMPRQNGKGDEIEVPEFWGLVKLGESILHTVHDAVLLASQAQARMLSLFDHRDLRGLIEGGTVWKGTGQQMILLSTGGQIWYRTRTGGGGRGVDQIDRLVVDEAQHATLEQLTSVTSTLMAAEDPQLNAMGTSGLLGKSAWWWSLRRRAVSPDPGRFGYVGHTVERVWLDDAGNVRQQVPEVMNDRGLWLSVNPAVKAGRGQGLEFLEEEWRRLGPEGFAQEHLGVWAPDPGSHGAADDVLARWPERGDPGATIAGPVSLGVAVSHDSRSAAIVACGAGSDGTPVVDLIDWRTSGTAWLADRLKALRQKHAVSAVAVVKGQPAESLSLPDVRVMPAVDFGSACVAFARAVAEGPLAHVTNADGTRNPLDTAVDVAVRKFVGEGWRWSLRESRGDITPLVGAVVALALHSEGLTYDVLDSVPEL